jgi:hypothetical protein
MHIKVGDIAIAATPMCPSGTVEFNRMRLDARTDGKFIEAGSRVMILRGDPTGYVVMKLDVNEPIPDVPGLGEIIRKGEHQRNSAEVEEVDREIALATEEHWIRRRQLYGIAGGCTGGVVTWAFTSGLPNPLVTTAWVLGGAVTAGVAACFTGWIIHTTVNISETKKR